MSEKTGPYNRYISKLSFKARTQDEVSFNSLDLFQLISVNRERWLVAKMDMSGDGASQIGYVPAQYMIKEWERVEERPYVNKGLSDKYVCVKSFESQVKCEITIKEKERLQVLSMEKDNWLVSKVDLTGKIKTSKGYVPKQHLVKEKPVEYQSWFINVNRAEAEDLLLSEPNKDCSFLVRPSEHADYCLSLRIDNMVVHLHIMSEDTGRFFISEERSFTCVHDLVMYYQDNTRGHYPLTPFCKFPSLVDAWERPSSDFELVKKMRSDSWTTLWEGNWAKAERKVLVHTLVEEVFEEDNCKIGIEILKKLKHRNIIELCALCTTEDPVYIVTEFMEKGDLRSLLRGEEGPLLTSKDLLHISNQVVDGMAYLEVKRVIHLCLMSSSVKVGDNLHCKISEFESAIQKKGTFLAKKVRLKWIPPEFFYSLELSEKTDVWSFGILLYEVFTLGQKPYKGQTTAEVFRSIDNGYRLPMPPLCTDDIYGLMLQCWQEDPSDRLSFQEIVESRILNVQHSHPDLVIPCLAVGHITMSNPVDRYVALEDFDGCRKGELSIKAGDRLQAVKKYQGWWLVEKINSDGSKTGERGHVSPTFLAEEETAENMADDQISGLSDKYISVKDFQATAEDEITVKAKERLQVLSMEKDRWLVSKVMVTGKGDAPTGYMPCGYLVREKSVKRQRWFTEIDGSEAENLLLSEPNMDGSFLVRPKKDAGYCLSVRRNKEVTHYVIEKEDTGKFFIFEERSFTCIHDLVLYYRYHLKDHCLPLTPFLKVHSQTEDSLERPISDFTLMKKLKKITIETSEMCLWEGNWAAEDVKVLVQTIPEEFFKRENFMRGIEIHKTLNHRNVTKLYALCTAQDPIHVVTEFMERGDLQTFLRGEGGLHLVEAELMYIAQQVADGMAYLEVKRVHHLDLACHSILVGNNLLCKIFQFGLSVQKKGKQPQEYKSKAAIRWMPPELIDYGYFSDKTDVWSFGIVLYEIFTLGQTPYKGVNFKEMQAMTVEGYRLPMPPLCFYAVYKLMLQCWSKDSDERPSFQKIVESKIFHNHKAFGLSDKYVSVKDFQATAKDEISINAKDRFQVHSMEKGRWLVSKVEVTEGDSIKGYVPCDYLVREKSVEMQSWFVDIDDAEAKTLLSEPNMEGSFLVRPSKDSHYCLSVWKNTGVINYTIKREDTGRFFIYEERSFTCVHDLVNYYQHHLVDQDCLPLTPFLKDPNDMEDTWEKPSSDFTLEEIVSQYKTATDNISIWKGKWIEGRRKVLIQTISKESFERNFMEGIEILKKLNHKNIIEFYSLCTTNDPVYIVTEFMEKGDLLSFLRGEEGTLLTEPELLGIAQQVADGMAYLELKRVLHLNLTCHNILVGDNLVCKISEFGLAKKKDQLVVLKNLIVPVQWMPPEVLQGALYSATTDVWSFGIVLYEIFTLGQLPYTAFKTMEEVRENVTAGYRLPQPPLCTSKIYSLMLRCWHQDPENRPSFQEIVESKIF